MEGGNKYAANRHVYIDDTLKDGQVDVRRQLSELFQADPEAPILVVIACLGGSVWSASAVRDRISFLRSRGAIIDCLIEGVALSGAALVAQACRWRIMGPSAIIGLHGISYSVSEADATHHLCEMVEVNLATQQQADILALRTTKPASYWKRVYKRNDFKYFDAPAALEIGLVDEIASPKETHA
jgi:ATP-dependent protease ClpP protease subunit